MSQLPLDLQFLTTGGRDDFIVTDCNRVAAEWIDRWPDWPGQYRALNLVGAAASGKSHLAAVWRNVSDAAILTSVDDAEVSHQDKQNFVIDNPEPGVRWNEEGLFHLFNLCADTGGSLLFLTREPLAQMMWQLPDLASRFRSCNMTRLEAPDDALLRALLEKYFADRQLVVDASVLDYMVARMERSFVAVQTIAAAMDRASLAQRRNLTMPLAREIMAAFALGDHARQAILPAAEMPGDHSDIRTTTSPDIEET